MENEKRGISQITGKTEIKLGEKAFYKVSRIHRKEDHSKVKNALWKIYVNEKGSWRELKSDPSVPPKKGDEVSYTITNQALAGKELLVEAYIYEPERMAPPGLKIKVVAGTEKKIQRVELFMGDDTPIKEDTILKYNQTIKVKVYTQNMPNEILKLTLYEDDADEGGHNPKNEKNKVAYKEKQTNENGFLWHEFKLNAEFSKIANAMMDGSSDKLHEYYVLVESTQHGRKTSKNIEAKNPDYTVHQTYENGKITDHKNDKIYEGGVIEEVIIKGKYKKQIGIDPMPKTGRSVSIVQEPSENKTNNCGEKYCIKLGDKSELIREINIRLAGFGGNVPTDEFTVRTEKMIKQFQRDYMKVSETGKVCGNVLRAIDEFSKNFDINSDFWKQIKCSCSTKGKQTTSTLRGIKETNNCDGFGDKTGNDSEPEKSNKYEYPGVHRSLLFGLKTILFYLSKQKTYSLGLISSGYRCRFKNYKTTNHQGKAIDIQFDKGNWQIRGKVYKNIAELEAIRTQIFYKYLNAKTSWTDSNHFSLEPIGLNKDNSKIDSNHTYSWIHMDVREFEKKYLADRYFCKNSTSLNGKSIVQLAMELGYTNTCTCYETYESQKNDQTQKTTDSCEDKFKRVAPIILKHEGGYVNDPADSGGMTNKGITIGTWKKYAKSDVGVEPTEENLKKITNEQATTIYRKRYWEPKGFCNIKDERVGLMVYDWSITSGGAGKQVQKLLVNEFGQTITIDGDIGSKTIEALNNVEDQDKLLNRISEIRKEYYTDLAYDSKGKPTKNFKFLKGWHNRVEECLNYTFE